MDAVTLEYTSLKKYDVMFLFLNRRFFETRN